MLGTVKDLVASSMWPWLVPAHANARFGIVSVGTELYQWSQTAKPLARPDSTGSASGVKQPMIHDGTVPGTAPRWRLASYWIAEAKFVTKPDMVATGGVGALPVPNSCTLVLAYPSPGLAPGMKYAPGRVMSMG